MSCLDMYKLFRVSHAVVRIDAVPKNVASKVLERTVFENSGDILEWEYNFRRSVTAAVFWQKLELDISTWLGKEICRLKKYRLRPVLYFDTEPCALPMFHMTLYYPTLVKLARKKQDFAIGCQDDDTSFKPIVAIPQTAIALLVRNKFLTVEIA